MDENKIFLPTCQIIRLNIQNLRFVRDIKSSLSKSNIADVEKGRFLFQGLVLQDETPFQDLNYKTSQFIYFQLPSEVEVKIPQRNSSLSFDPNDEFSYETKAEYTRFQTDPTCFDYLVQECIAAGISVDEATEKLRENDFDAKKVISMHQSALSRSSDDQDSSEHSCDYSRYRPLSSDGIREHSLGIFDSNDDDDELDTGAFDNDDELGDEQILRIVRRHFPESDPEFVIEVYHQVGCDIERLLEVLSLT